MVVVVLVVVVESNSQQKLMKMPLLPDLSAFDDRTNHFSTPPLSPPQSLSSVALSPPFTVSDL